MFCYQMPPSASPWTWISIFHILDDTSETSHIPFKKMMFIGVATRCLQVPPPGPGSSYFIYWVTPQRPIIYLSKTYDFQRFCKQMPPSACPWTWIFIFHILGDPSETYVSKTYDFHRFCNHMRPGASPWTWIFIFHILGDPSEPHYIPFKNI